MPQQWTRREVLALGAVGALVACGGDGDDPAPEAEPVRPSLPDRDSSTPDRSTSPTDGPRAQPSAADLPPYELSADFPEGIMSGDPLPDGVVLWTRPSPELVATGAPLVVEVALDVDFADIVRTDEVVPDPTIEGATAFVVDELDANAAFFYRFRLGEAVSPIGLTRTAPGPDDDVESLTMAVFSCQRFTHGYYTAHADMADQAPDVVLCLGDYVYERAYADDVEVPGRDDPVDDARTLEQFRRKYEHYRSDIELQKMHRTSPLIAVPDNHDGSARPDDERYPGAHEAFFEKMPVRRDPDDDWRVHRRFTWGRLVDLWMLDTLRYLTPGSRGSGDTDTDLDMMDPDVTYLGADQKAWLLGGLADTQATWQILGSPKQFSPLRIRADPDSDVPNAGTYINLRQWDGYQAERQEILAEVERLGHTGTVVVSGDMHWFWAADVPRDFDDPDAPPVMVDLLCGGISSSNADEQIGGGPQTRNLMAAFGPANENYVRYFEGDRHGYGLLTFTPTGAEVEYRSPVTIREAGAAVETVARMHLDPDRVGIELVEPVGWSTEDPVGS